MISRHFAVLAALTALLMLILTGLPAVEADGDSTNGELMPTTLWMNAGSGDELKLWPTAPGGGDRMIKRSAMVDEFFGAGYVDMGTWETNIPLDKNLTVQGQVKVILFVNSTDASGPRVRFRITLFGETSETQYYGTNPSMLKVELTLNVNNWNGAKGSHITMGIEVDADGTSPAPGEEKEINLWFFHPDVPGRIEFGSDATEIEIVPELTSDGDGVKYYEIIVKIRDFQEDKRIIKNSFVFNITSIEEPETFTAEHRGGEGGSGPAYLVCRGAQYWGTYGYTEVRYDWYYEGRKYSNGIQGQGAEAGDYTIRFELRDNQNNSRYHTHTERGVSPQHVYVNIHTHNDYLSVVDARNRDVAEVAANDEVRVRVWIEVNRGKEGYTYEFSAEFRDNGATVENGRMVVQMEGKTGRYLFFDWIPTTGDHELTVKVDSDNDWDEIDESDNLARKTLNVIPEARPNVIISHPGPDQYINNDIYAVFDASNSTNPLEGDMTFRWAIFRWEGDDWVEKERYDGARVEATRLIGDRYGAGQYKAEVTVDNDKRQVIRDVIFYFNSNPIARMTSPENNEVYSSTGPITFDARDSEDPDGDPLFFWWFSSISGVLNRPGPTAPIEYSRAHFDRTLPGGTHEITLEVYDYDPANPPVNGRRGMARKQISMVVNTPPRIEITEPKDGFSYGSGIPIAFDASRTDDSDGDNISFSWSAGTRWLSDDMVFETTLNPGIHTITLEVSDGYTISSQSITITVGSAPTAVTRESVKASLSKGRARVTLDASGSQPSDESVPIVKYYWDRGSNIDADPDNVTEPVFDIESTDPTITLEYTEKGTYIAWLMVEDSVGIMSEPVPITVVIAEDDDDDDDFPVAMVAAIGVVAVVMIGVGGFIYYQKKMYLEEEDDGIYADEPLAEEYGEFSEGEEYPAVEEYGDAEYEDQY